MNYKNLYLTEKQKGSILNVQTEKCESFFEKYKFIALC